MRKFNLEAGAFCFVLVLTLICWNMSASATDNTETIHFTGTLAQKPVCGFKDDGKILTVGLGTVDRYNAGNSAQDLKLEFISAKCIPDDISISLSFTSPSATSSYATTSIDGLYIDILDMGLTDPGVYNGRILRVSDINDGITLRFVPVVVNSVAGGMKALSDSAYGTFSATVTVTETYK